jgi:hypothetical protein
MEITLSIEDSKEILEKANRIILAPNKENYTLDDLISIIDELTCEYDHLEEEFMDFKAMIQDNYEEKNPYDLYGVCECEFH